MPEPVLTLYSLGAAPFSFGSSLVLWGTIGLLAKCILPCCFLLHDWPSLGQRLFFPADHEHFYFLSADLCYYDDMHLEYG